MTCPRCGVRSRKGNAFCPRCGAILPQKTAPRTRQRPPTWMLLVLAGLVGWVAFQAGRSASNVPPQNAAAPAATSTALPTPAAPSPARAVTRREPLAPDAPPSPVPSATAVPPTPVPSPTPSPLPTETPIPTDTPIPPDTAVPTIPPGTDTSTDVQATASNFRADPGTDYDQPRSGYHFALLHITLVNNGHDQTSYNELDFHAQGTDDNVKYPAGAVDTNVANTALTYGQIAPGQTIAGDLAFELPNTGQRYRILWTPNIMNGDIYVPFSDQ